VVLLDKRIDNSNSEHKLDVIDYPAGLYFVRVELEDQILVKKLFIYWQNKGLAKGTYTLIRTFPSLPPVGQLFI
jgi:hypothetical protein